MRKREVSIAYWALGAMSVLIQRQTPTSSTETPSTGIKILKKLTPMDRRAMISLSAESLPKTSSTAVRNPQGMVNVIENGSTKAMKAKTVSRGTL